MDWNSVMQVSSRVIVVCVSLLHLAPFARRWKVIAVARRLA